MSTEFYSENDYEQSSGPLVCRNVYDDLDFWPNSTDDAKDALEAGMHPILAIGQHEDRPWNVCGAVLTYDATSGRIVMNIAPGAIYKAYVENILTYSGGDANIFETAPEIGQPVFVDDSDDLPAGVTLSLSPLNDADEPNPRAGVIWYCQDEDPDGDIGGANADVWPKTWADEQDTKTICVMLWPTMQYTAIQ
jgi:hypothetical protein